VGSRVTPNGFAPKETVLAKLKVGADGQLNVPVTIPDDLGGLHSGSTEGLGGFGKPTGGRQCDMVGSP